MTSNPLHLAVLAIGNMESVLSTHEDALRYAVQATANTETKTMDEKSETC